MPPHQFHGPIYCETGHPWLGMAEPVNTITNAAIIIAAYLAYRYVKKSRLGFSADFVSLLFLFFWVGIGSALWHGLRTAWALQLDWVPGVLFLLVFAGLWVRQLFGRVAGLLAPFVLLGATIAAGYFTWRYLGAVQPTPSSLRFVPVFGTITLFGIGLVAATAGKFGADTAWRGAIILLVAISAAVFRSIDLLVCDAVPFGTHFLWHICLSTSAFLGIVLLVRMKKAQITNRAFSPSP